MPSSDGTEARLRHFAVTALMVGVAIYVSGHLILAVAPALVIAGVVAGIGVVVRLVLSRRRW